MNIRLTQAHDERIAVYHCLKDKSLARQQGLFVVEGEHLVRRLLTSILPIHSLLMTEQQLRARPWDIPPDIPVYLTDRSLLSEIVGFDFHRGVLAMGHRPQPKNYIFAWTDLSAIDRLLICPEINDVENLGSILRSAAGLGFAHVLLGPSCCDPWSRRAIRTSMGTVFKLQLAHSQDLIQDLNTLQRDYGFQWHTSVIDPNACRLKEVMPPAKVGLLLGSEAHGLPDDIMALAHQEVTIPMALHTDSLNVGVAAGIFMHHYSRHR